MENTEVLVHISAPSGASDDARYRAQVAAILSFQSASLQNISVGADAADDNGIPPGDIVSPTSTRPSGENRKELNSDGVQQCEYNGSKGEPNREGQSATADNANETGSEHEGASTASPQVLDSIGLAAPLSNAIASPEATLPQKQYVRAENDSLGTPVSVIPDSQPGGVQVPERDPEYLDPLPQPQPEPPRPEDHRNSRTDSPSKRRRVDSPTSADGPKSRYIRLSGGKRLSPLKSDTPKVSKPSITDERQRQHQHRQLNIQLTTLPLQIRPPPPPISTSQFTTHITPTLAMLATRLNPSRIYKPVYQTRSLEKLERGYWFLRINVPDPELESDSDSGSDSDPGSRRSSIYVPSLKPDQSKRKAKNPTPNANPQDCPHRLLTRLWTFLSRFIAQEARAGWGVWCILEEEEDASSPASLHRTKTLPRSGTVAGTSTSNPTSNWNANANAISKPLSLTLKIYTWGEITTHIYLLLFLASERRVKGMGAQWRDARGEVVVRMP